MKKIVKTKFKEAYVKTKVIKLLYQVNKSLSLGEQFCCILYYLTFKIFKNYNKVE